MPFVNHVSFLARSDLINSVVYSVVYLRQWVKIFYNDISSAVIQSGHLSSFFNIQRGCRQGDPLSPYLFVICAEFLATKIKKNDKIKGITVNNIEIKISQYADDTSVNLDGTETSLNQTLQEPQLFF